MAGSIASQVAVTLTSSKLRVQPKQLGSNHKGSVQPHPIKFWQRSGNGAGNKKASYRIDSWLLCIDAVYLVGRAGVEPTTNGLKVRCSTD